MIGFRVTNQMMLDMVISNLQANDQLLAQSQKQISTGHALSQASDDPFAASQILDFHQRLGLNEQLQANLDSARGWLDATDQAMGSMMSILQRARQLAIQGSNDTLTAEDRQDIALEIHQIMLNMVDLGNSKFGDEFIFGGTKTTVLPFVHDGTASANISGGSAGPVKFYGDAGSVTRQLDQAAQLGINISGTAFHKVYADLAQLEWDLSNDRQRVSGERRGINLQSDVMTGFPGATAGTSKTVSTFSINGVAIGTSVAMDPAMSGPLAGTNVIGFAPGTTILTVVNQINAQTNQSGVTATVDRNGVLSLQLAPGVQGQILISNVDKVMFDAAGADLTNGTGVAVTTAGNTTHDLGIREGMENAIGSVDVHTLDDDLSTVSTLRSQVGAKTNRVQLGTNRLSALAITLTGLNSKYEDVDMAKALSELASRQTTFQAALGAAAKVLPPTLLDFLR